MKDIVTLRKDINEIDNRIIELWKERMELCLSVAQYKKENKLHILDAEREKELLDRVGNLAGEDLNSYCRELYKQIMKISRDYQQEYFNKEIK